MGITTQFSTVIIQEKILVVITIFISIIYILQIICENILFVLLCWIV